MTAHAEQYANWHIQLQVPTDTLHGYANGRKYSAMANDLRNALKWHMETHDTKIVDLVRSTGVSRDVINKLLMRDSSSTTAENAILIAAYYGKTVNQFVSLEDVGQETMLQNLVELLEPSERLLVSAQIKGMLAARSEKLPPR